MLVRNPRNLARKMGRALTIFALILPPGQAPEAATSAPKFLEIPSSYLREKQCSFNLMGSEDVQSDSPARLTSGWSQEGVGVPEVREFIQHNHIALRPVSTGIADGDFDQMQLKEHLEQPVDFQDWVPAGDLERASHGSRVALVIAGKKFGLTHNAYFSALYGVTTDDFRTYLETEYRPLEIMNRSLSVSDVTAEHIREMVERNEGRSFLLVNSAGNQYISNLMERGTNWDYFAGVPTLLVSAITPSGRMNSNSGGGPNIVVSAPSYGPGLMHPKHYEQALDGGWTFSGTSAAAPMVTGALVGVLGLLKGLSYEEARELLVQTSFLTPGFREGHNFGGYGVLNYYKMMRVAQRLKQMGWPSSRHAIFKNGSGSVYDFSKEVKENLKSAEQHFKSEPTGSCKDKLTVLRHLRRGFFLDSHHTGLRQALYALYANERYHDQALYFSPLGVKYHGSGAYAPFDLERDLLDAVAGGDYQRAISTLRKGISAVETLLDTYRIGPLIDLMVNRPGLKRSDFMRLVQNVLPTKMKTEFTELLLSRAYYRLSEEILLDLLHAGIELDQDYLNRASLEAIVQTKSPDIVGLLLEKGADPNYQSEFGFTGLILAANSRQKEILEIFLEAGAEVNASDRRGKSALTYAITRGPVEIVKLLIRSGARVDHQTLALAKSQGDPELTAVIEKHLESKGQLILQE